MMKLTRNSPTTLGGNKKEARKKRIFSKSNNNHKKNLGKVNDKTAYGCFLKRFENPNPTLFSIWFFISAALSKLVKVNLIDGSAYYNRILNKEKD